MNTPHKKFLKGQILTAEELRELADIDKCRYVAETYFPDGFNAIDIATQLNKIFGKYLYTAIEVYDLLKTFYGKPGQGGCDDH